MSIVLISGGGGFLGNALTGTLLRTGRLVRHLSRKPSEVATVPTFAWDPSRGTVDPTAFENIDHIVHLSGAPIADKRWTKRRLKELDDSRAGAALLLRKTVHDHRIPLKSFISASGINYYGAITSDHIFTEEDPPGTDTIGRLTLGWEEAADSFKEVCRVVKLRQPVVLARNGGALPRMTGPVRRTCATPIGSGHQWWPWVHIDDLVRIYVQAINDERMQGSYNVNAPELMTNRAFMRSVALALHRPFLPVPIPGPAIKLALGGASAILLHGSRVSNARLLATGFRFRFDRLDDALRDCLS